MCACSLFREPDRLLSITISRRSFFVLVSFDLIDMALAILPVVLPVVLAFNHERIVNN
jgi:hypothetical protein